MDTPIILRDKVLSALMELKTSTEDDWFFVRTDNADTITVVAHGIMLFEDTTAELANIFTTFNLKWLLLLKTNHLVL